MRHVRNYFQGRRIGCGQNNCHARVTPNILKYALGIPVIIMKRQSRKAIEGPSRAPHRAMYKAMGLTNEDLDRPLIGVSSTCNEATPCNLHLGQLAQSAKRGVSDSGCTPREFTAIAVS